MKPVLNFIASCIITTALGASVALALTGRGPDNQDDQKTPQKKEAPIFKPITYKVDTLYVTDEMYDSNFYGVAGGTYKADTHEITLNYAIAKSYQTKVIKWCANNNKMFPAVLRHEREHGRKMLMVTRDQNYDPLTRGRLAAMNEIMAPCAEIIEAADHHRATGDRYHPLNIRLYNADSLIQKTMNETQPFNPFVDYTDQKIADIVLHHATDKFIEAVGRGFYKHTIQIYINTPHSKNLQPNTECDWMEAILFNPQMGDWAPLFRYKTNSATGTADIWTHASKFEKQRTLNLVDSVINVVNPAAKYMILPRNQKTH